MDFKWKFCKVCNCFTVMCPKCGNNSCNGRYGGENQDCEICPLAYAFQILAFKHKDFPPRNSVEEIGDPFEGITYL